MPGLKLYNSLSRKIELFQPANPDHVSVYHCGPTVYKRQHIGNLRRFLFADFLHRTLEFFDFKITEITNITDVGHLTQDDLDRGEDKMEREAHRQKTTPQQIAQVQTKQFFADLKTLNISSSTHYPRATKFVPQMIKLIQKLIDKKHAYQTDSGIYFDVESFPDYGRLSGNTTSKLVAGQRIAINPDKRNPADFSLWVFDDKALQLWDSPWGQGYPGWHIECSAMSLHYFDSPIDIHTGGEDNLFPHHENEIAQSEAATGKTFVRFWLHNKHLRLSGEKMAKGEGMQITLDDIIAKGFSPLAFRLLIFGSHYRKPVDFSWDSLQSAQENINTILSLLRRLRANTPPPSKSIVIKNDVISEFRSALAHDLNTPAALAVFMKHLGSINSTLDQEQLATEKINQIWHTLLTFDAVIGVVEPLLQQSTDSKISADVQTLIDQREQARHHNKFDLSDKLRLAIENKGYTIEDTPNGPRLIKK